MKTIAFPAAQFEDYDDSLAAAEQAYADTHNLHGWNLNPRWADDERETILLVVPT